VLKKISGRSHWLFADLHATTKLHHASSKQHAITATLAITKWDRQILPQNLLCTLTIWYQYPKTAYSL